MKRTKGLGILALVVLLALSLLVALVATSAAASGPADEGRHSLAVAGEEPAGDCWQSRAPGGEPPVPDPCSWCVYYVEWWQGEQQPAGDPDETDYFAAHTVEWLDANHTETLPYEPPPPPIVIPDPTFHGYVDFYGGPGHPAGEWAECEPERYSRVLLDLAVLGLESFNSRNSLLNWKTIYSVDTVLGPVLLHEWEESIVPVVGDPGWPWVVGEVWETATRFCLDPPVTRRHMVEATETIVTDLFPGGIECYRVCTERHVDTDGDGEPDSWEPSECRWYHDSCGCPIRWEVYPWDLYTGWEYRELIWCGADPPFPPFAPPPTPTPTPIATPMPTPTPEAGVGGTALPTDKVGLMLPWMAAGAALLLFVSVVALWSAKRRGQRAR